MKYNKHDKNSCNILINNKVYQINLNIASHNMIHREVNLTSTKKKNKFKLFVQILCYLLFAIIVIIDIIMHENYDKTLLYSNFGTVITVIISNILKN